MKATAAVTLFCLIAGSGLSGASAAERQGPLRSGIPFDGAPVAMPLYGSVHLHDPGAMCKDGASYFIFGDGVGIAGITSTDLRNWSYTSAVFSSGPPAWTTNDIPGGTPNHFWAPDQAWFNGRWHMYYAYSQWGTINSAIGLATSPSLVSPVWTDRGKVVESSFPATANTDTTLYNCIDPGILADTNGTVWMVFGSYSAGIVVTEIDPATGKRMNPGTLDCTLVANNAAGGGWGSTEEAGFLFQRAGYYYLFVNTGSCCSGITSTYRILVGRSTSPTGPYYDRNGVSMAAGGGSLFLESTAHYIGPGHAAIMDDNGRSWFTYHYYDGLANGQPTVGVSPLYWDADGWPVLTNDWSALYPLAADASESRGLYSGTLQGGAGFASEAGRGPALNLDGSAGHVVLPSSVGNAGTFAAWVNWRGGAAWQRIFDFGADTTNYFMLTPMADDGRMRFAITTGGNGGEQRINAPGALPSNSWHHVAVTLDGAAGVLYLDGSPVATNGSLTIRPWQTLPQTNYLGRSRWPADPLFGGSISSFRVFGRALSAGEIGDVFRANAALSHRYSFSADAVTAGWDSIGMAHGALKGNATVVNGALALDGASGSYADLPGGLISGSPALTLECWATFGVNGSWSRLADFGDMSGGSGRNYCFFSPHTASGGQMLALGSVNAAPPGTLDGRSVHLACVVDPASRYLGIYTNGALEAEVTNASLTSLSGVSSAWSFIGRSLFSSDAYLNADIAELRLYAARLTPAQLAANSIAGPDLTGGFGVWSGLGGNRNWTTGGNWVGGASPIPDGDRVFFAGAVGLDPNLDASHRLAGLAFDTSAGSFALDSDNGSTLTLAGALVNDSAHTQTVNVALALSGTQAVSASPGTLVLAGPVTGSGGLSKEGAGMLTLTGDNTFGGGLAAGAGTLNIAGGTSGFSGDVSYVGYLTGSSALTVTAGAVSFAGELRVGGSDQNGSGIDATGTVTVTGGELLVGALTLARGNDPQNRCSGSFLLRGGVATCSNDVLLAWAGAGRGRLVIDGGTFIIGPAAAKWFMLGAWDTTASEMEIAGGNLRLYNRSSLKLNRFNTTSPTVVNQSGGAVTFFSDAGATIGGSGNLDLNTGGNAASAAAYNLNGGLLTIPRIIATVRAGSRVFNFNGGTLRAATTGVTLMDIGTGEARANVRNGGAVIDTNGKSVTNAQALVHSNIAGDSATDGGLTKLGAGTLTLTATNTYSGPTAVRGGTLRLADGGGLNTNTVLTIRGGTVSIDAGRTQVVKRLYLGGVGMRAGTWGSTASAAQYRNDVCFAGSGIVAVTEEGRTTGCILEIR
jgi:autotransporter-associated beta strand protein